MQQFKKILLIRTDRFGELLLNTPAIHATRETFPQSRITLVVCDYSKEAVSGNPDIDKLIVFNAKGILEKVKFIFMLKKEKFDLAVMLSPSKFFNIATFLAGIKKRVGYDRKWGFLLTDKIKDEKFKGQKHEVEYNLDLVRHIGANTDTKDLVFVFDKEDEIFVKNLLASFGISPNNSIVGIHPASSNPAKMWPAEYFIQLIDMLKSKPDITICLVGTPEYGKLIEKIIEKTAQKPVNLCGKFTLKQLGAFLKRCSLLISNDSGPVHLAAAVGTPVIAIFGRNIKGVSPKRWGPWGKNHVIFHKDPGCNPCLDRNCPYNFKCLTDITPQQVYQAAERIFRQPR